jgi:hypothetical protein
MRGDHGPNKQMSTFIIEDESHSEWHGEFAVSASQVKWHGGFH